MPTVLPTRKTDLLEQVLGELEARLESLRPAVAEYERLHGAAGMLEAEGREQAPAPEKPAPRARKQAGRPPGRPRASAKPSKSPTGEVERAIVAALDHGSHTVAELSMVTARTGAEIRASARRLLSARKIVRASRDGRPAYALAGRE